MIDLGAERGGADEVRQLQIEILGGLHQGIVIDGDAHALDGAVAGTDREDHRGRGGKGVIGARGERGAGEQVDHIDADRSGQGAGGGEHHIDALRAGALEHARAGERKGDGGGSGVIVGDGVDMRVLGGGVTIGIADG